MNYYKIILLILILHQAVKFSSEIEENCTEEIFNEESSTDGTTNIDYSTTEDTTTTTTTTTTTEEATTKHEKKIGGELIEEKKLDVVDCNPNCENTIDKACNKFELHLRSMVTSCNKLFSPFSSKQKIYEQSKPNTFKCAKKLHVTLKIINKGETTTVNQYVIVDYVTDSKTGQRVSLLNPYVIVIRQKPVLQLYGLKFKTSVNAEAKEVVLNKRNANFTGCDDVSESPTCGTVKYNEDVVPYSQGFCCSCDDDQNLRRQTRNSMIYDVPWSNVTMEQLFLDTLRPSESDFIAFDDKKNIREKRSTGEKDFNDYRSLMRSNYKQAIFYVTPRIIKKYNDAKRDIVFIKPYYRGKSFPFDFKNEDLDENVKFVKTAPKIQIRGGQECDDDKKKRSSALDDSAHCLRFSKLWYAVYQLSEPVLEHSVLVKIFEKKENMDGSTIWVDETQGKTIFVGTLRRKYEDESIKITYENPQLAHIPFDLDPRTKNLLIPQRFPKSSFADHPEVQAGPPEFLVVDRTKVQTSGESCDTAGVGYSAFYSQPDRCSVPRGSCLHNQPSQLWRHDKRACNENSEGPKYFLKSFARVPENAVRQTKNANSKYLALEYTNEIKSVLDIEVQADDNIVFRNSPIAKITEVYVDGTSPTSTIITIKVHNEGLIANLFHPKLSECPLELPVDWGNLEGTPTLIPPQHKAMYTLRLMGILPIDDFYCTVEVLNNKNEIVAIRRIRIISGDRCICSWHCLCACYIKTGLGCVLMSMSHYKAAGFVGSMPLATNMVKLTSSDHAIFGFFTFLMLLLAILLILGLTKAVVGLWFYIPIGIWGLDMLIDPSLDRYYECSLRNRCVIYDDDGWPVHPDTLQRTVRVVEKKLEFCLNFTFFFTYPFSLLMLTCSRFFCFRRCPGNDTTRVCFDENVYYSKCSTPKNSSESENEDPFEFEDYPYCKSD